MSDDLVKRLRNPAFGTETSERLLMVVAADRIDELEVSLQAVLNREAATTARYDAKTDELEAKLAECLERNALLEARLGKAVEALVSLVKQASTTSSRGAVTGPHWTHLTLAILKARTTLAEIEGGKG
jgi:hypothetical protein